VDRAVADDPMREKRHPRTDLVVEMAPPPPLVDGTQHLIPIRLPANRTDTRVLASDATRVADPARDARDPALGPT
jgi:hypothetical protein